MDQDEEGHRREGKGLSEPHPRQAVDPARRRYREGPLHELVDEAGASEDEDETEPDDKGRGDDGEHGEQAEYALGPESSPRGHESEGEPEPCRGSRREERQGQGVPGDAALSTAPQAVEPPDLGGAEATEEGAHGERPPVGLRGAHQDADDRKEREETDEDGDEDHGAGDEGVAPEIAPGGEPCREQEEEGGENDERAAAQAELTVVESAEESLEKRPGPAGKPDRESLGESVEEAGGAQQHQGTPEDPRGQAGRDEGAHQHEARREQPGASELHRLQDGGREVALGQHPGGPAQAEETVRERVPRQHEKAQAPEDAPDQRAPAQTSAHGPVATSAGY